MNAEKNIVNEKFKSYIEHSASPKRYLLHKVSSTLIPQSDFSNKVKLFYKNTPTEPDDFAKYPGIKEQNDQPFEEILDVKGKKSTLTTYQRRGKSQPAPLSY